MAVSANKSTTLTSGNGYSYTLAVSFTENSTDTNANTSKITCTATLTAGNAYFSSNFNNTLTVQWIDGTNGTLSVASKAVSAMSGTNTSVSVSGSINVKHTDAGSLSGYAKAVWTKSDNNTWTPASGSVQTASTALTTIARASTPSLSGTVTAGTAVTISTNRASSSFTHTLTYSFGSASGTIATGVGASTSWTPPTSLMAQITKAKSGTGTITCTTYNGSTSIGSKSISFTLNQPSDSAPTIAVAYGENGVIADGSTKLTAKGVATTTVIGLLSIKTIKITGTAKYSASISKITCSHNGTTQTSTTNGATFTWNYPVNTGSSKSVFAWTVTDSRGNVTSGSVSMAFVNYQKPQVGTITATRDSATASTGKLSANGTFFNGTVGSVSNSVTVQYTYNSATTTATVTKSSNNWSFSNVATSSVAPANAYTFTVKATDSLGYSASKSVTLDKAVPTLWIGKETVRVNNNLILNDVLRRTAFILKSTNTATLLNLGTWSNNADSKNLHITYIGGTGYNGHSYQNSEVEIWARNGSQSTTSATGAFGVTYKITSWYVNGTPNLSSLFAVSAYATAHNSLTIYMYIPAYATGMVTVDCDAGTWTTSNTLNATVSGTKQDCQLIIPAYPIGSIYMSVNSTSPATLFGGTWVQLQDRFLLGAGSTYSNGATGGEATHKLTVSEMPKHSHTTYAFNQWGSGHSNATKMNVDAVAGTTTSNQVYFGSRGSSEAGGDGAHNNMPPYLVVYMWKRTA